MKMKILHKGICEQEILIALVVEESGEACIMSQFMKIFINLGCSQEFIRRPFTRPNLTVRGKLYLGFGAFSFELWLDEPLKNLLIIF